MKKLFSLFVVMLMCVFVGSVKADSIAVSEEAQVQKFSQDILDSVVMDLLKSDLKKTEKIVKFENVFVENLDMEYVSKFLLGKKYKTLGDSDLDLFNKEFREFILYSWIAKFDLYQDESIVVKSIVPAKKDNQAFVNFIISGDDEDFNVQLRVRKINSGAYKIADIKIEGVSMLLTYKKEFKVLNEKARKEGDDEFQYLLNFIAEKSAALKNDYLK